MQIEHIKTPLDYEDFCDFIESKDYKDLQINKPYIITDEYKFIISKDFSYVFDDLIAYITDTPPKEEKTKKAPKQVKKEIRRYELIPKKVMTISNISFNIY